MRALRYAFDEAVASLWRGRRSGILSTATIAVALFVLGSVPHRHLESRAARRRVGTIGRDVGLPGRRCVGGASAGRGGAAGAGAARRRAISSSRRTKRCARFKATFADLAGAVDTVDGNPLPASYEVRLQAAPCAKDAIAELAATLEHTPGVSDVRYDRQWLDRLLSAVTLVRRIGLLLGAFLTIAAALTVANVVRLALWATA